MWRDVDVIACLPKEMEGKSGGFSLEAFEGLTDERSRRNLLHGLSDIIFLTICAVVSGADGWTEVENFGHTKLGWLRRFVGLKNGIPSHDTLGRVFGMIRPEEFESCFGLWVANLADLTGSQVIAIDGKTLRGSYDTLSGKSAIHMVSAWASANRIVMGQVATAEKSNEITAIPLLLSALAIAGCVVTIDAMGCQKEIVSTIRKGGADYLIAVKGNQPGLLEGIQRSFNLLKTNEVAIQIDQGHGRVETRRCELITDLQWMETGQEWEGLKTLVRITSTRHDKLNGATTEETRHYISSLKWSAEDINNAVRAHWGIENSLHYVLDVTFSEDAARNRQRNSDHNLAVVRRIALNLLKLETSKKASIKIKRQSAAMDDVYREQIIYR